MTENPNPKNSFWISDTFVSQIPSMITVIVALITVFYSTAGAITDLKVSLQQQKIEINTISERLLRISNRLDYIDKNGSRDSTFINDSVEKLTGRVTDLEATVSYMDQYLKTHPIPKSSLGKKS